MRSLGREVVPDRLLGSCRNKRRFLRNATVFLTAGSSREGGRKGIVVCLYQLMHGLDMDAVERADWLENVEPVIG